MELFDNRWRHTLTFPQLLTPFHYTYFPALEVQKSNVEQLLNDVQSIQAKLNSLPDRSDHESSANATLELLQRVRDEASAAAAATSASSVTLPASSSVDVKLDEIQRQADEQRTALAKSVENLAQLTQQLSENVSRSYDVLRDEIEELSKVEQVSGDVEYSFLMRDFEYQIEI